MHKSVVGHQAETKLIEKLTEGANKDLQTLYIIFDLVLQSAQEGPEKYANPEKGMEAFKKSLDHLSNLKECADKYPIIKYFIESAIN